MATTKKLDNVLIDDEAEIFVFTYFDQWGQPKESGAHITHPEDSTCDVLGKRMPPNHLCYGTDNMRPSKSQITAYNRIKRKMQNKLGSY